MNHPSTNVTPLPSVLVIGGANMDIVAHTDTLLVRSDSNPGHVHCAAGGVARNVAHNLALMGHRTALVSVLGGGLVRCPGRDRFRAARELPAQACAASSNPAR